MGLCYKKENSNKSGFIYSNESNFKKLIVSIFDIIHEKSATLPTQRQPEVADNYSCLFFLSIYNFFINVNYFKKVILL